MNAENKKPWWITLVIIVAMLPVTAYPSLLALMPDTPDPIVKFLMVFYPIYVLVAGLCAWICFPRRPEITWILIVIMLLSHAAMWVLVGM